MEHTVRCQKDVEFTIASLMSAMEDFPFAVSDGFAVQIAISEALSNALDQNRAGRIPEEIRVRSHVTPGFVRIHLEDVVGDLDSSDEQSLPGFANLALNKGRGLHLMRTYMTSVEFRKNGRQVILYRARGQGSAISGPPLGYDFQI